MSQFVVTSFSPTAQTLADAGSLNDAWKLINAASAAKFVADADAGKAYSAAVTPLGATGEGIDSPVWSDSRL